jgi:hypothetical protein
MWYLMSVILGSMVFLLSFFFAMVGVEENAREALLVDMVALRAEVADGVRESERKDCRSGESMAEREVCGAMVRVWLLNNCWSGEVVRLLMDEAWVELEIF